MTSEIAEQENVSRLVICSGQFDLLVEFTYSDNAQLLEAISHLQNMPQVQYTESFVYFSVVKELLKRRSLFCGVTVHPPSFQCSALERILDALRLIYAGDAERPGMRYHAGAW